MIRDLCLLHLSLRKEHGFDELKDTQGAELFSFWLVLFKHDHFDIDNIVHQTQKHVELADDQV